MRNYLKFLATAMIAAVLVCAISMTSFAAVTPFTDVDDKKNETLSEAVELLVNLGVTKGTTEKTFGTMEHVTRQQMAAFVYRLMKNGRSLEGVSNDSPFTDLTDSTYFGYVSWANAQGIIKGKTNTTFDPKGGIILQDAYTMVVRALGHEDDTYQYPFTHIDKAEELGLDNGLDSVVNYDTKLTRGDVAIILYNAFFAEMGKEEVKQTERLIGSGDNAKWVLEKKTVNPTLAEDVYDVEIGTYTVRATPKYAFNESADSSEYVPLCDEYDSDMLQLVATESDEALSQIICEFDGTGLSGAADDYIMQSVKVYYTYEEKNGKNVLDDVYFMAGSKVVLESSGVTGYDVDAQEEDDYYWCNHRNDTSEEKVEGYVTVGNETIYFFDAPYTYLKPNYNSISGDYSKAELEELRYNLRNEKNAKLINIKCLDLEKGTYSYYVDTDKPTNNAEELITNILRVYSRGVYKMRFYDVDADGIYEYAHYMPATYGFMDGDDGKYFSSAMTGNEPIRKTEKGSDLDLTFVPTIYYNDAKISGVKFEDGDMVVAYLNPEANMIEVMGVVKPYTGYISLVRTDHGIFKIDSTSFQTAYAYRVVDNLYDGDDTNWKNYNTIDGPNTDYYLYRRHTYSNGKTFPGIITQNSVGEMFSIYAYKAFGINCVLYYDHLDDATIAFGMDELVIPVSDEDNAAETFTKSQFNATVGDTVYYAKAYLDGKVSYIPLDVEEMFPALDAGYDGQNYNLSEIYGQNGNRAYVDKICKFNYSSKTGLYTLIPLLHAEDEDGLYCGINNDSTTLVEEDNNKQYGNDLGYSIEGYIKKVAGSRYELVDAFGNTLLGDFTSQSEDAATVDYFTMTAATRIVIKNTLSNEEDEVEYLEFDASTFTGSSETPLTNIQYVLKGDPDSAKRADLVLLYAEATDFEFTKKGVKNGWRIVAGSDVAADANGDYRYAYRLLNPYTGAVEENVLGETYKDKASQLGDAVENGAVIEVKGGYVDENGEVLGTIDTSVNTGLVWITEYDEEEGYIGFVPVEATDAAIEDGTIACKADFTAFIEGYTYDFAATNFDGEEFRTMIDESGSAVEGALFYEITDDTVISVLKNDKPGIKTVTNGEFTLADISAIAKATKEHKCYNISVLDRNENYTTAYADYVKAYVYAEEVDDEEELPVAQYIIIVVNGNEDTIFTDNDPDFLPKSCDNH